MVRFLPASAESAIPRVAPSGEENPNRAHRKAQAIEDCAGRDLSRSLGVGNGLDGQTHSHNLQDGNKAPEFGIAIFRKSAI